MSSQVCSCGALKQQYRCPVCSSPTGVTHVTILPPLGASPQVPLYPSPPLLPQPQPLSHPLSVSTNYVLPPPLPEHATPAKEASSERDCEQSIKDSLVFLSVCEDLVECVVGEVLPEQLRETVNSCLEDIIHSYLSVREESQAQSDLRPLPDEGTVEGDTGESVQPHESLEEVCGWICGRMLEECVFETLLEAALTRGANLVTSEICNNILEEMVFEELLRMSLAP